MFDFHFALVYLFVLSILHVIFRWGFGCWERYVLDHTRGFISVYRWIS